VLRLHVLDGLAVLPEDVDAHDGLVEGRVGALDQVVVDVLLRVIGRGCIMVLFLIERVLKRNLDGLEMLAEDLIRTMVTGGLGALDQVVVDVLL
jgi:hypothetical protein